MTIRSAICILAASLASASLYAQTLFNLGGVAPTPGANDIYQLSLQGNKTNPDGLNYFTDNETGHGAGEPGRTDPGFVQDQIIGARLTPAFNPTPS